MKKVLEVKKRNILAIGLSLMMSSSTFALNINETLEAAYVNNDQLKAARQRFLSDIEAFPQALAGFLPDVSASISSTTTKSKEAGKTNPAPSSEVGPDVDRSITISQNLFAGGRSVEALKSAQAGFYVDRSKLFISEGRALTQAVDAYLAVSETTAKHIIAKESLEFYLKNLHMAQERLKVGESTVTDVALANSNVANAKAAKAKQYADLLAAKAQFKTIVGMAADSNMPFPSLPKNVPKSLEELEYLSLRGNNELIQSKHELKQANSSKRAAVGALAPSADIALSAGRSYLSPESTTRRNSMSYTTKVSVTIPIYSKGGSTYSSIRSSKKVERQAVHGLDFAEKSIKAQAVNLWENYQAAKEMVEFTKKHVAYQKLALDGIKQEYEVGSKTMIDVLKSQEDYNKAKTASVDARKQYVQVAYKMKELIGDMNGQRLKLKVEYFNPEKEFRNIKHKIVGF